MRALIFLTFISLLSLPASGTRVDEVLYGFLLKECGENHCSEISAPEASRSEWDEIYVFADIQLTLFEKKKGRLKVGEVYKGTSGYYDPSFHRLVLRGFNGPGSELMINLKSNTKVLF